MSSTAGPPFFTDSGASAAAIAFDYLARAPFVALTTYRKDGRGVTTTLWIAPDGDELLCWTGLQTAKVKRLRRDDRITVQICSRRGRVGAGTPLLTGTGTVLQDPADAERAMVALRRKYGLQARILGRLAARGDRRPGALGHCAIRISLDVPSG